jgi:hypothetical protein
MRNRILLFLLLLGIALPQTSCNGLLPVPDSLTEAEVIAGLKEALKVGTDSTVVQVSLTDGYLGNQLIKILLPPNTTNSLNNMANSNNIVVQGLYAAIQPYISEVIVRMNRAAEQAANKAKPIFWDAITGITIQDGWNILRGADTAATAYLRSGTENQLFTAYRPDIEEALNDVGAQQLWNQIATNYNQANNLVAGAFGQNMTEDLASHVTSRALHGLFVVVGQKETDIRTNVSRRVTDLLRKVFAAQDGN